MKRKHLLTLTLFAAMAGNLLALDITEPFSSGILTNFEGYYGRIFPKNGKQENFSEFIIGGGFTENLSYFFSGSAASNFKSIESVGLNFIWQFISTDNFASCLIPHAAFIADEDRKLTAYYDLGVDLELHLSALKVIQPYLGIGYSYTNYTVFHIHRALPYLGSGYSYTPDRKESDDYLWTVPIHAGVMVPVGETGIEIFGQFSVEPCKDGKWDTITRYAAGGINYQIIENLELITEGGYEFTNKEVQIMVGLIFAL